MSTIIREIEALNGKALSAEEQAEVESWQRGRALAHQVNSPGWDAVLEILQGYATAYGESCVRTDPGETNKVLAAHAVAYAADRIYRLFIEDVQNYVEASQHTPSAMTSGLHMAVPPQSL
jgi:hypothetical protein